MLPQKQRSGRTQGRENEVRSFANGLRLYGRAEREKREESGKDAKQDKTTEGESRQSGLKVESEGSVERVGGKERERRSLVRFGSPEFEREDLVLACLLTSQPSKARQGQARQHSTVGGVLVLYDCTVREIL